jgi:hypothetical protein
VASSVLAAVSQDSEVLVANAVGELAKGKSFLFADCGEASLKGFDEPGAMSQPTRGGGSLSTQMGVIVHMITLGMSACGPCREKRPRLCAWAGGMSTGWCWLR